MFLFSAALRSARAVRSRALRHPRLHPDTPAPRSAGGPYLHWVPDRPEGERLAGEYLPLPMLSEHSEHAELARRPRRRR